MIRLFALLVVLAVGCGTDTGPKNDDDLGRPDMAADLAETDFGADLGIDAMLNNPNNPNNPLDPECLEPFEQATGNRIWGNLQFPEELQNAAGTQTAEVYGQLYSEGETEPEGPSGTWRADLLWGPHLTSLETGCWKAQSASFNINVENNDEFKASLTITEPGVYGLLYRYTHDDGRQFLAGLDGPDGSPRQALLMVTGDMQVHAVFTQNLKCREDWESRKSLLVEVFTEKQVDIAGLQEDCLGETSQAAELTQLLANKTGRGYMSWHQVTHQADSVVETWLEGISIISAIPFEKAEVLELDFVTFPRRAIHATLPGNSTIASFINTHLDFGVAAADSRLINAERLADEHALIVGDFNATPDSDAVTALTDGFEDVWDALKDGQDGFTFPATNPSRRIDYVFVPKDWEQPVEAELVGQDGALSDHLGLIVSYP